MAYYQIISPIIDDDITLSIHNMRAWSAEKQVYN